MLYIKFTINKISNYVDFNKLFQHMELVRQTEFEFEEAEPPEINWDNLIEEEIALAVDQLLDYNDEDKCAYKRFKELMPSYATAYVERYLQHVNHTIEPVRESEIVAVINYLEQGFDVDMDSLEQTNENQGVVRFSTGNFPFGGLDRFIMILKAFDLEPTECFNGFSIVQFKWMSDFEFESLELEEETQKYLRK